MDAIQKAGVPDKFGRSFLESLGFKSTNDRAIVAMLKAFNFLDQNGIPIETYKNYKNPTIAKSILGQQIKEAYSDIFLANEKAQDLSLEKLKGMFATISGKGDTVAYKMAQTFKTFCSIASFDPKKIDTKSEAMKEAIKTTISTSPKVSSKVASNDQPQFHYNIQIHLPATRDITVYNAIFKSLKEHIL